MADPIPSTEPKLDESKMPLLDHLVELRRRLMWAILAFAIAFGVCLYFAKPIFGFLVQPLTIAFEGEDPRLIYTKLYEVLFVELKIAMFAGFFLAFPVIANQIWLFVAPGLYSNERRAFLPFLIATPLLFTAGAALAYYIVMPLMFGFLLDFEGARGGLEVEALPNADAYLSFVMQIILAFGIAFLLPVLLLLLNKTGLVQRQQLVRMRRYMIVGAFIFAAVLTPPDIVSQLLLGIPLILLFEGSLLIMLFTERRDKRSAEASAASGGE